MGAGSQRAESEFSVAAGVNATGTYPVIPLNYAAYSPLDSLVYCRQQSRNPSGNARGRDPAEDYTEIFRGVLELVNDEDKLLRLARLALLITGPTRTMSHGSGEYEYP
ncbi:hypothetical protein DL771_000415 [Monosporascus sp. 5C6A]|nr:hypothetical protein DL771_000415 [Monosporascus sp. 5C6A]